MKRTKLALFHSVIALMLCLSMLVGTTFAWFTDTVTSTENHIIAGNLDVDLKYSTDFVNWNPVDETTNIFDETLWEPGHTEVVYLEISNAGNLALKYRLGVNIVSESGSRNQKGESFLLSDYIQFGAIKDVTAAYGTREAARDAVTSAQKISAGFETNGSILNNGAAQYVALVVYMPEDVKNEANYATGENPPQIKLGLNLYATQEMDEQDSFGSTYDSGATLPLEDLHFSVGMSVAGQVDATTGTLTEEVTLGSEEGEIYAEVPTGVKLADGATALTLKVDSVEESQANIDLESGEVATPINIHVDGLDNTNNAVPLTITLKGLFAPGLNQGNYAMYHVENGVTVPMNLKATAAEVVAHNDYYYDVATGDVVMCAATFSEYVPVTNNYNYWNGKFNFDWYDGQSSSYYISTADELAGFGAIVDGGYHDENGVWQELTPDTFENEFVYLDDDIDLYGVINGNRVSFNPIGCGYVNGTTNSKDANGTPITGRAFMGTFNGQGHTISNLYQNGWELGLEYCTLGGGLFASIANGAVQNLTITGADIRMECVEQGILVGLSQGNCTYSNINIYNSKVANYQRATGGLVGEVSPMNGVGTTKISNVVIGSDVVVGSMWGDFDAPVGGVIGAKWDDTDAITVEMNNVTVACRLDVYNDVTSSYQWYAYRRAGMLIGNTEETAAKDGGGTVASTVYSNGTDFLKCNNVKVYYAPWVNYHYCEFTNANENWPFVRVEAGENCSAFSNPRWGVPNDINGKKVVDMDHVHADGDDCNVLIKFNQLYGGGQGVYGDPDHTGVEVVNYLYSVTYVNNGKVLDVKYVMETDLNDDGTFTVANAEAVQAVETQMGEGYEVNYWMNAGSSRVDTISAGNVSDVKVYPSFKDRYTVTYVNNKGEILHWETIVAGTAKTETTPTVPAIEGGYTGVWSITDFSNITGNVTVYPIYNADDGIVKLTPVDSEPADGIVDYYIVTSVEENDANVNIVIPSKFNGKDVTEISGSAFAEFDNITTVTIPTTIEYIGADAFANEERSGLTMKYEQITFLYEGTYAQWQAIQKDPNWDRFVGQGSRIYYLAEGTYSEETARNSSFGLGGYPERVWSEPQAGEYTA